jgi:hypothetical protein
VQKDAYEATEKQITDWGIEHNQQGWRAEAYLYCVEVVHPITGYLLPISPSWIISEKYKVCAVLKPDHINKRFEIEIITNADNETLRIAKLGTLQKGRMVCPETGESYSIQELRGDRRVNNESVYGLRLWENDDLVPRPTDVFQERVYCVRWLETSFESSLNGDLIKKTIRHFCSVTEDDLQRDGQVLKLLKERFNDWQNKGYLPSQKIERGYNTDQPIRERGWSYWHHLYTPRQLLMYGCYLSYLESYPHESDEISSQILILLKLGVQVNWNSKLCVWNADKSKGPGSTEQTFANLALNTLFNFGTRSFGLLKESLLKPINYSTNSFKKSTVSIMDARDISESCDLWITDPPYADAVNYHEVSQFFGSWYEKKLTELFPSWNLNMRDALAVRGNGQDFKLSMVEIYSNLAKNMPDNGLQMVQFTHQDPAVWADLGMILWAAGLQVSSAWTISTETSSGLKKGNYVQGTVLLVLRKRTNQDTIFPDELPNLIEDEVQAQLDDMLALDDKEMPNFGDTDYQLAAYAAALRVMTQYATIEGISIENELYRERQRNQKSEFERLIDQAVEIACNHLIPVGFNESEWKGLAATERLYLKGLELEKHGELRAGAYQELAKGFGVREYILMFARTKANEVRFKTATEFNRANLGGGDNFAGSLMRQVLFALHETVSKENAQEGINYLKDEIDFWGNRKKIIEILRYLNKLAHIDHMQHWAVDAEAAQTLAGAIENFNA